MVPINIEAHIKKNLYDVWYKNQFESTRKIGDEEQTIVVLGI